MSFEILNVGCGIRPSGDVNIELYVTSEERKLQKFTEITIPKCILVKAIAESLPFPNETFSIIICNHVLEHVLQPYLALMEFLRVLKPNGILNLELPNVKMIEKEHPSHLYSWSLDSIKNLLLRVGFKIETFNKYEEINMKITCRRD